MTTRRAAIQVMAAVGRRPGVHAGAVAADPRFGALVGELARDPTPGTRRDSKQDDTLHAVRGGLRGARALRRRAAGGAGGSEWRALRARRDGTPSALLPGACE